MKRAGPQYVERYADLLVGLGANVQSGQLVEVRAEPEMVALVRAVAERAYATGASFVDPVFYDPQIRRARIANAPPETLADVPHWHTARIRALGEARAARISLFAPPPDELYATLDPALVSREPFPFLAGYAELVDITNWVLAPCPTPTWARTVHPELSDEDALDLLWCEIAQIARLDEPNPERTWHDRVAELDNARSRLDELQLDSLHFEGPGTDLTIGLLPGSRWAGGWKQTTEGIVHLANVPTEGIFTAPDPRRADGVVTTTRPVRLKSGLAARGLCVRFAQGRVSAATADEGEAAFHARCAIDDGASRLGEVSLVDSESQVSALGTVFGLNVIDEYAGCHLGFGTAFDTIVAEQGRPLANRSAAPPDYLIFGGEGHRVTGVTRTGEKLTLMVNGAWAT